jgi:hypothetical protein
MKKLILFGLLFNLSWCLHAQYFNQRYTFGVAGSLFNSLVKTDSCFYTIGVLYPGDGVGLQKMNCSQFGLDGTLKNTWPFELDTFQTYIPTIHTASIKGQSICFEGGLGAYQSATAFASHFDIPSQTISLEEYVDTTAIRFWSLGSVTLASGNKIHLGNYQTPQYRVSYFIVKTDSADNELWRKYFPVRSDWQEVSTMFSLQNGNLLIGSQHGQYTPGSYTYSFTDLIEIDTLGNQISAWQDTTSIKTLSPCAIVELPNREKIYAANYIDTVIIATRFETDLYLRGCLVKLDSVNHKVWEIKLGRTSLQTKLTQMKRLID